MTRTRLQLGGFGAINGELMVDFGLMNFSCSKGFWVGSLMIFLGWFSHVGLGLMNFSCSGGFDGG